MNILIRLLEKVTGLLKWLTLRDYDDAKAAAAQQTVDYIQSRQPDDLLNRARKAGM